MWSKSELPHPAHPTNLTTGIDQATFTEEANQTTEDQIGLDKGQRRDVQRRLTGLGFGTKVNGRFDESTRAVITRWQEARGYPTGNSEAALRITSRATAMREANFSTSLSRISKRLVSGSRLRRRAAANKESAPMT